MENHKNKKRRLHQLCVSEISTNSNSLDQPQFIFSSVQKFKSINKKKLSSSLQGRPAKASKYLRLEEERIKKQSWDLAMLEECLYLCYGGAIANEGDQTEELASNLISHYFSEKSKVQFREMVQHTNEIKKTLIDPLGQKYNILSPEYFLDRLLNQNNNTKILDLEQFLIVFVYFIYRKTNLQGFKQIIELLKEVYQNCSTYKEGGIQNIVGISTCLCPQMIHLKIIVNNNLEHLYDLLYVIMKEVFSQFNDSRLKYLVKNVNQEYGQL